MASIHQFIADAWKGDTLEALKDFIRIPAKSRAFDADWEKNGFLMQALEGASAWGKKLFPNGIFEIQKAPDTTPALFVDIPASLGHTGRSAFFYGHFDKQPETKGWDAGKGPWMPVVENGRLYGRGAADDGYSFYTALTAVQALEQAGIAHPRITGIFETDEESGSRDLPHYLKTLAPRIGSPAFLGILDLSLCDYSRIWLTQSLRGVVSFKLTVEVLRSPVHSGICSGLVPSSFAVMRELLDRLEDPTTGRVKLKSFWAQMPERHQKALACEAKLLGDKTWAAFPYAGGTVPRTKDPEEAVRRTAWSPSLSVLGADGLPSCSQASALLRPSTSLLLSFRIPPYVDAQAALAEAESVLLADPPSNAVVTLTEKRAESGFDSPELAPWLRRAVDDASTSLFGEPSEMIFEGATIGTMGAFAQNFPESPFLNTGVLGTVEHAHAPNESLNLAYVEKLTEAIAQIVAAVPQEK